MPYEANEVAHEDAIELYRFSYNGYFWRFTDSDVDITKDGEVFRAEPVSRGAVTLNEESTSADVDVMLPALNQVARLFSQPYLHSTNVWLTIMRLHVNELTEEPGLIFSGEVTSADFSGAQATLRCSSMRNAVNKVIPVQLVGRLCSNALYDQRCRVNPALFGNTGLTVSAVSGNVLTVSGISGRATGFFDGGYVFSPTLRHTSILTHTAPGTLRLMHNPGYLIGDTLSAYAGCDKRYATCRDKFNNVENHQGFMNFPTIDPFDEGVV